MYTRWKANLRAFGLVRHALHYDAKYAILRENVKLRANNISEVNVDLTKISVGI